MKKFYFLVLLVFLFNGCSQPSDSAYSENVELSLDQIKELTEESPDTNVSVTFFGENSIQRNIEKIKTSCKKDFPIQPYYLIEIQKTAGNIVLWLSVDSQQVVCSVRKGIKVDSCFSELDCDDGLVSTIDKCEGTPRTCSHGRITECRGGDNFCPSNCTADLDGDCVRQCTSNDDCSDENILTEDICYGLIKVCTFKPLDKKEAGICEELADCEDDNPCTIDSCTDSKCSHDPLINGTFCDDRKECFDGACVSVTENEMVVKNIEAEQSGEREVKITWTTNKQGDSTVKYGVWPNASYDNIEEIKEYVVDHEVLLQNISVGKKYVFKVRSADRFGQTASEVGGDRETFTLCLEECDDGNSCTIDSCNISLGACETKTDTSIEGCTQ